MANNVVECISCGHVGASGKKGSITVFIVLLIIMFPLGIIYWILNRGGGVCSACKSSNIKLYRPERRQSLSMNNTSSHNVQQIQCPDCREYIRYDARKCKHCGTMIQ